MPNINFTTILGYSLKKEYVGTTNYRNIITVEVETLFKTTSTTAYDDILQTPNDYSYAEVFQSAATSISLNGNGFGVGRVVSVSEPRSVEFDESGLKLWKRNITIEFYEVGDNSNTPDSAINSFYARLKNNLFDARIKEITENFSFTDDESGNLGYVQTVSVSCVDEFAGSDAGVRLAREKAQSLIESEVDFGYLGNLAGLYGKAGKKIFSTNVDIINGTVSITKTFTSSLVRSPANYNFTVDTDGSITISERITLKNQEQPIKADGISSIINILNNIKSTSYSRCYGYFSVYKNLITQTQAVDETSESIALIRVNRGFDEKNQEYSQELVFSNSRSLRSNYVVNIQQNAQINNNGITTVSETGTLSSRVSKTKGLSQPLINSTVRGYLDGEQQNSLARARNLYNKIYKLNGTPPLKLASSSRTVSSNGKSFGYTVEYTNDPKLVKSGGINSINSAINANIPKKIVRSYIVPGSSDNKSVFNQEANQSSPGSMGISQTAILKRTDNNKTPDIVYKPSSIISTLYNNCLFTILNRLTGFGLGRPDNFVINSVSYSYNSNREAAVNVSISYFVASNKFGPNKTLYTN